MPRPLRNEPEPPLQGSSERHTDPLQQVPPVVIEKPVERIVEVEKIVERVIEKPVEVEKVVIVEKPVEKIVYVDRPVQQPTPPLPERIIEKTYVYIPPEQRTDSEVQPDRTAPPVEVKSEVQPNKKKHEPEVKSPEQSEKVDETEKEKFTEPLNFSPSQPTSEAGSSEKMEYEKGDLGRQRKYYQTIALLEMMYAGNNQPWDKLEPQMQRYYKRTYPEYFGRDGKVKQQKREENKIKAARIRHERLQREYRRSPAILSHH